MSKSLPTQTTTDENSSFSLKRYDLLGFFVHPGTLQEYVDLAADLIQHRRQDTILYHNLHSLYSYFTNAELRKDYADTTVLVDGMPIIWLMQLLQLPVTRKHRLTYVDFIYPLLEKASSENWKVYHIGQHTDVQQQAIKKIKERFPSINITGHDGYFDLSAQSKESLDVINQINDFQADLVLVGFGAPKQEAWLHNHRDLINAPAVFACGACMEYVAGAVRTPPRWMGRTGLEWLFRFAENPRRFAFRYLIEPVLLIAILLKNAARHRLRQKQAS